MACYCARNRDRPICKFAMDLVIFIMRRFYPGYEWEPIQDVAKPIVNSPFKPPMKNAVKQIFLDHRLEMHSCFEEALEVQGMSNIKFGDISDSIIAQSLITELPFNCKNFLNVCVSLCSYAARSYQNGAETAPMIVMTSISQILEKLTAKGYFTDDSWTELNEFCEVQYPNPAS